MSRSPRDTRRLYPDPVGRQEPYGPLRVYWLEVDGLTPARRDYEKYDQKPRVLAALTILDMTLGQDSTGRSSKLETFVHRGVRLWEIKAPERGSRIFRLLAYRESDWDLFVAFAKEKRSQQIPAQWKDTAASRVKAAQDEGGPL